MICKPCRGGAHQRCPGGTHCTCQHRTREGEYGNAGTTDKRTEAERPAAN